MKVVQINAVYGIMSTGRNVRELEEYLESKGHESVTFYGGHPGNYGDNVHFMGSYLSHKLHAVTARLFADAGCGSNLATKKLLKFLSEYKPDIVHLNNLHGNFVNINILLKYLADNDIPTVVHLHDCFSFTGGCMHYTANKCQQWQSDCKGCQHLLRGKDYIFRNKAERNLSRKAQLFQAIPHLAVCGVSQWIADEARKSPVFKNAKIITHVYNWIDIDVFKPQGCEVDKEIRLRYGIGNRRMILGVASGWGHGKGLEDFIELSKLLSADQVIVLVGKMPDGLSLPYNIIHIGATDRMSELAKLYSAADVFVHLSREETFGKVIAEALACGTPAVVYNSTAMPEIVDEATGRVVEPGNVESVLSSISELTSSNRAKLCRHRAECLFAKEQNCQRQLDVYHNISKCK